MTTAKFKKLTSMMASENVEWFVYSAIENQIEGNLGSNDEETAKHCGISVEELEQLRKIV